VVGARPARKPGARRFAARHTFLHNTVIAEAEWFRNNPYSEDLMFHRSQDAELWCRTSTTSRFVNMPELLVYYREFGCFSFPNYLGTSMGILHLAHLQARNRAECLYHLSKELAKCWITSMAYASGKEDWIISRRFRRISESDAAAGEAGLEAVKRHALPLRSKPERGAGLMEQPAVLTW
jgi:hypothetical protein